MHRLSLVLVLPALVITACDGDILPGVDDGPCDFGQRKMDTGACESVDHLQVNLDERLEETDGLRRGIGVVACSYHGATELAVDQDDECAAYSFEGTTSADPYHGDGGAIVAYLPEREGDPGDPADPYGQDQVFMTPSPGQSCYDDDVHPQRSDLFELDERVRFESEGGEHFPAFAAELDAPAELVVDTPEQIGEDDGLKLKWEGGNGDHVLVLVQTYDPQKDHTSNVLCFFDDDGEAEVSATMMDRLEPDVNVADLFVLRQTWKHIEPDEPEVAVDVTLTTSVVTNVRVR